MITHVLLISLLFTSSLGIYTLVKHPIETGARCLDGSEAALYYNIGKGDNKNKFMLYWDSGGLCADKTLADTLQSCYKRSFTGLGSSTKYPATRDFPNDGLLSDSPEINPVFHDWTKVWVSYCDGSEYQGSRLEPISYKGRDLYFRGANNSMQQFQYLNDTFGLYAADFVVMTGVSAGGIATYHWSNYLYDRSINKKVVAMPDSGLFVIDYINPFTGRPETIQRVKNLVKLIDGEEAFPLTQCTQDFGVDNQVMCFSAGLLPKYLKAPFFIVESLYDQWSVQNILGLTCTGKTPGTFTNCSQKQITAAEGYRVATLQALANLTTLKKVGIWSPACIQHGFTDALSFSNNNYRVPSGTGPTAAQAIKKFIESVESEQPSQPYEDIYIDDFGWPNNSGCSGLRQKS